MGKVLQLCLSHSLYRRTQNFVAIPDIRDRHCNNLILLGGIIGGCKCLCCLDLFFITGPSGYLCHGGQPCLEQTKETDALFHPHNDTCCNRKTVSFGNSGSFSCCKGSTSRRQIITVLLRYFRKIWWCLQNRHRLRIGIIQLLRCISYAGGIFIYIRRTKGNSYTISCLDCLFQGQIDCIGKVIFSYFFLSYIQDRCSCLTGSYIVIYSIQLFNTIGIIIKVSGNSITETHMPA